MQLENAAPIERNRQWNTNAEIRGRGLANDLLLPLKRKKNVRDCRRNLTSRKVWGKCLFCSLRFFYFEFQVHSNCDLILSANCVGNVRAVDIPKQSTQLWRWQYYSQIDIGSAQPRRASPWLRQLDCTQALDVPFQLRRRAIITLEVTHQTQTRTITSQI